MTIVIRAAAAAFLLSCLPGAALAQPQDADRVQLRARVSHAGLDLTTSDGRASFLRRVRRTAGYACSAGDRSLSQRDDGQRCVREMMADAEVQVAALNARREVQLASTAH